MNGSDDASQGDVWCSGLTRSYSEHADLVLNHCQHHRRRLESPRYTRSGPDFVREHSSIEKEDDADDEDEAEDPKKQGQRTWRMSTTTSEDGQQQRRRIYDVDRGDTGSLDRQFSELNLERQPTYRSFADNCHCKGGMNIPLQPVFSSSSQETTTSSAERRCRISDKDGGTEQFGFVYSSLEDSSECRDGNEQNRAFIQFNDESATTKDRTNVVTSASSACTIATNVRQLLNGKSLKWNISYENWAREKQQKLKKRKAEKRRIELTKREFEEREKRERKEKERRDYECFLKWLERKKEEESLKKELMEKEIQFQKKIQDVEEKAKVAKDICLKQWYKKKEEQKKALEKKEQLRKKKSDEEKQRRLQESVEAFERWREKSKSTPRPATQGLLPHQKAKPTFTNPTPWHPLIENASDGSDDANGMKSFGTPWKNLKSRKNAR